MSKKIYTYDTTMRDGAQSEGVSFSVSSKLRMAKRLDLFGIDYIEGGYAGSNEKDMSFFREIAKEELRHAKVAAFGSTRRVKSNVKKDQLVCSMLEANTPVVTIVGKSWNLHVRDVLRCSLRENLAMVADTVEYIKDQGREVFFDAEHFFDGYMAAPEYALEVLDAAVGAGVDAVVLCDTNGGTLPYRIAEIMNEVVKHVPVQVGIHAHNDSGMAEAVSIEAVRAGARQVQGTVNGYGERCGNADLCTVIPCLMAKMGMKCVSKRSMGKLRELSRFVDELLNLRADPKAPFVGDSAFCHKAGPHVNAVQKNSTTFEHVPPESVGNERHVVMSELAGSSSVLLKAVELGLGRKETAEGAREILGALKDLESKGYAFEAADASFKILVQKVLRKHRSFFELEGFRVIVEKRGKDQQCLSEATVKVRVNGEVEQTVAEGDGPVDALDGALRKALMRFYPEIAKVFLTDFRVRILDPEEGTAAKTRVLIESSDGTSRWGTVGVSENIIEASWEALVDSVEYKLFEAEEMGKKRRRKKRGKSA